MIDAVGIVGTVCVCMFMARNRKTDEERERMMQGKRGREYFVVSEVNGAPVLRVE